MQAYQQRVVEEKSELDSKIERLSDFIGSDKFAELPRLECGRLLAQKIWMEGYSEILSQRIAAF